MYNSPILNLCLLGESPFFGKQKHHATLGSEILTSGSPGDSWSWIAGLISWDVMGIPKMGGLPSGKLT